MKVSRSTAYGLLAVSYIAKKNGKIVLSNEISENYKIPLEYLLKIMQYMTRKNILISKRGPRGGFKLAKEPDKISMLDVIEAVDGPIEVSLTLDEHAPKNDKFAKKAEKAYLNVLKQAKQAYEKIKLSDLL